MKFSIDGIPIGELTEKINIEEADIPQSHNNILINPCKISGAFPMPKELSDLLSKLNEIAEEEFQKHKIKKVDYFKYQSQAPAWLEDEFQICSIEECESLQKGKWFMYPWDIYQDDIIKYGVARIAKHEFDVTYKRVLLIVGTGD